MDHAKFFAAVRTTVFGGRLSTNQVNGAEALIDACASLSVVDDRHIAYILATPMIETGGTFVPITESLNYSAAALTAKFGNRITAAQANQYGRTASHPADQESIGNIIYGGTWGAKNLGNTQPGDGYLFRGRGLVQTTGRRLYALFGHADNPDEVCDVNVSAAIMVKGMRDGTFTGKKLSDYFNATVTDWVNARRIVNGTDRADDIAGYAKKFAVALAAAA
ncbi:hypothetical protein QD357_01970 [Rhizobium sp. BR 317]|uniref:hypothetical protein n=1 Tax=Rhizobium sp. BR 317 TaxID=3040015 RepID=UPI0039BF5370